MKMLAALDLDGTCLDNGGQTTPRLRDCLGQTCSEALPVYATGREFASALQAIKASTLPLPAYLVSDVGNRVYRQEHGTWELDPVFEEFNVGMWDLLAPKVDAIMAAVASTAVPQDGTLTRRFGFWADNQRAAAATANALMCQPSVRDYGIVGWDGPTSEGRWWVDVLPACGGKATAVSYIAILEGIPADHVIAIGNSLNDIDLLDGRFRCGAPADAAPRLIAALKRKGHMLRLAEAPGPDGTAAILSELAATLTRASGQASELEVPGDSERLAQLRMIKPALELIRVLSPWPDRLRNWGLRPGTIGKALEDASHRIEKVLSRGRNWWWESAGQDERQRILQRFGAIPLMYLIDRLTKYVDREWQPARLLGGMVSGSYLYGPEESLARDLDMVLLLDGLRQPAVGFEIEVPGLRAASPGLFAHRLQHNRVGLGLIDIRSLNESTQSMEVLQMAASMEGSGMPLFGQEVVDAPMPAFDLLCQAVKLINDGRMPREPTVVERRRRISLRCDEASRVVRLASRRLAVPEPQFSPPPGPHAGDEALTRYTRDCRQAALRGYLHLVQELVHPDKRSTGALR